MIGIIDYDRGNLHSVSKALERLNYKARVLTQPTELPEARALILPGVGAFADAMAALGERGWLTPLREYAAAGRPFLGICLGMQVLFEVGEEHGEHAGLGILPGRVVHFPAGRKTPHMGWNSLHLRQDIPLFTGIPQDSFFYFVHSYHVVPAHPEDIAATCSYGLEFAAAVCRGNVWGTQFHPEKSSPWGLRLLDNFGKYATVGNAHNSNSNPKQA
jgi:glutamine amidotransferase